MAVVLMMMSVLAWSIYPVIAAWGIEQIAIWEFIFFSQVFSIGSAWLLLQFTPGAGSVPYKRFFDYERKDKLRLLYNVLAFLGSQICLLGSFSYITKAGATIAFETWPIFAMYLTPVLMKKSWDVIPARDYLFAVIALAGVVFILCPEVTNSFFVGENVTMLHYGAVLLPVFGGFLMAAASAFKASVAQNIEVKGHPVISLLSMQVAMGWYFLPITGAFALFWPGQESTYTAENIFALAVVGIFILTMGALFYTWSLLRATRSNITVLWYFVPVFSAVWFWWTGTSAVTDYIIIGAILVISSNLLISTKADNKLAYMTTLVSLLAVGIFCYFTEGIAGLDDYYEAIGVPIVFFVILVAFTMDRLIRRDVTEENIAIGILHTVLRSKNITKPHRHIVTESVTQMLRTNNVEEINALYKRMTAVKYKNLEEVAEDIDRLALSKIQNTNFGDLFVTALIGFMTVGVTILFRVGDFVADAFAIGMTGAVVFIFFNIVDLSNSRKSFHLEFAENGERMLAKDVTRDHSGDIILSSILIFMLLAAFTGLLWYKHYGF